MTCQKVCKQGRDDIIVKVNYKALSLHLFTLQLQTNVKTMQGCGFLIYLHYYIIPTLFAYYLACHPYTFLHF